MTRYLPVPLSAFILSVLMSTMALAHSKMSTSKPADGSTVEPGLEQVELNFKKAVRLVRVLVNRTDKPAKVPLSGKPATTYAKAHQVDLPTLGAGAYRVEWTALAKDGHVMKGRVSFSVRP